MRRSARLAMALAMLGGIPEFSGASEAQALRIMGRVERARASTGPGGMSAGQLQEWASRRRRARQTHVGKRRGVY